jgi:hypothetical protein
MRPLTTSSTSRKTLCLLSQNKEVADNEIVAIKEDQEAAEFQDGDDPGSALCDEELLLACRAYLQKKNRLGLWTLSEERKQNRKQQQKLAKGSQSGGFFWDDPLELIYYRPNGEQASFNDNNNINRKDPLELETIEDDEDDDEMINARTQPSSRSQMATYSLEHVEFDVKGESENDRLEEWSREFSSFPTEPSESRIRRSQAAKRRWDDPEWKAKWYQKRWEGKKKLEHRKQLSPAKKNSPALTMEFMSSPEFNSLSEDEIFDAVTMYQQANAKRANSLKLSRQHRKEFLKQIDPMTNDNFEAGDRTPRDALLLDRDEEAIRLIRSERQKKSYQTRLQNLQQSTTESALLANQRAKRSLRPTEDTAKAALKRIRMDLDLYKIPQLDDLVLIASETSLGGRKHLMRRLLSERFDLRGKCIPDEQDPDHVIFVTNARIHHLMEFTIAKVRESTDMSKTGMQVDSPGSS